MKIELIYALPASQELLELDMPPGSRVMDAILASKIMEKYPELAANTFDVGIFSQKCDRDQLLEPGDRIEIYRPLQVDPKDRRRQRLKG